MTDRLLQQRISQVLAELAVVSEAEAGSIVTYSSSAGDENDIGGNRPAGPKESMADRWRATFERIDDERWLWIAVEQAEAELEGLRKRRIAWTDDQGHPLDQVESEDFIISLFEGVNADVAAIRISAQVSSISAGDIRRIRERNDRDRDRGLPRHISDGRRAYARRLHAEGKSLRKIAIEMNVAKGTVQRLLSTEEDSGQQGRAAA